MICANWYCKECWREIAQHIVASAKNKHLVTRPPQYLVESIMDHTHAQQPSDGLANILFGKGFCNEF